MESKRNKTRESREGRERREKDKKRERTDSLDGPSRDAWPKPAPDIGAKLLPSEGHAVHAERRLGARGVKEIGEDLDVGRVVGGGEWVRGPAPVCRKGDGLVRVWLRQIKIK